MRLAASFLLPVVFAVRSIAGDDFPDLDYAEENQRTVDGGWQPSAADRPAHGENRRNVGGDESTNWSGRWMPDRPDEPTPPPKVFPEIDRTGLTEPLRTLHGVPMGQPSANCDDAKTNLTVDWDGNPIGHTCYEKPVIPDTTVTARKYCEHIPKYYAAMHKCMNESIEYDDDVPLFGSHRPLWPVYGEYKYLPRQRWLHSLEHGAIVALYHPCVHPLVVKRFKNLVQGCLRRHVISPYDRLDLQRPLVLVSWGCRLSMAHPRPELVVRFIREQALKGPENIARDGNFTDGLLRAAKIVSDFDDSVLCPDAKEREGA